MSNVFVKDPQSVLDYSIDWSSWLVGGDTISSHTVTAQPGLTMSSVTASTTTITFWLAGGTAGQWYDVTCHVVTTGGRTEERTLHIQVSDL